MLSAIAPERNWREYSAFSTWLYYLRPFYSRFFDTVLDKLKASTLKNPMRLLTKLLGLALLVIGVYFLGQNIIFTTRISRYWWRDISAAGSVFALTGGIISLLFFRRATGSLGGILIGLGILLVFLSGNVILMPTSLWYFFVSFVSLVAGLKLITTGRIDF